MNRLLTAATQIQDFFLDNKWDFCIIGGMALLRWGQPRLTQDVDLTLLTGFGNELPFVQSILETFEPRIDEALDFAMNHRVVLVRSPDGIGLDITLAGLAFEEKMIRRATWQQFSSDTKLLVCSAEDLIVQKVFAGRHKDWGDVESIIKRQKNSLDWPYIESILPQLLTVKDDQTSFEKLLTMKNEISFQDE